MSFSVEGRNFSSRPECWTPSPCDVAGIPSERSSFFEAKRESQTVLKNIFNNSLTLTNTIFDETALTPCQIFKTPESLTYRDLVVSRNK